jgi:2-methylcitrate dehydratase PrpD
MGGTLKRRRIKMVAENKVTVQIPAGMTAEDFLKSIKSWESQKAQTQKRDKAAREAQKLLMKQFPVEYKTHLTAELKKVGLTPKA